MQDEIGSQQSQATTYLPMRERIGYLSSPLIPLRRSIGSSRLSVLAYDRCGCLWWLRGADPLTMLAAGGSANDTDFAWNGHYIPTYHVIPLS